MDKLKIVHKACRNKKGCFYVAPEQAKTDIKITLKRAA